MKEMTTLSYKLSQSVLKGYINYESLKELNIRYDDEVPQLSEDMEKSGEELIEILNQVDAVLGRTGCIAVLNLMNEKCQACIVKYLQEDYSTTDFVILMFKVDMIPEDLKIRSVPLHGLPLASDVKKILEDELLVDQSILNALIRDSIELKSKNYPEPEIETKECLETEEPIFVTTHAHKRYVERFRKGVDDYTVDDEIMQAFENSELIWAIDESKGMLEEYNVTESAPTDVSEYWYNASNNIMFVLCNKNVKTVYPMNFGFAEKINVEIAKMQIAELRTVYDLCKSDYAKYSKIYADSNRNMKYLESEISDLKSKIKFMESDIALSKAKMSHSSKMRTQLQESMKKELDKLFKKWRNKQC